MRYSLRLFRIGGIDIGVHFTWVFIFMLISWSLAQGYFPQAYPNWTTATYWTIAVLAALLLFVSVLLHELAHSFVARARGMEVSSITLFIFGGVSNMEEEPEKPRIEFAMSIVGPLTSLVLAGVFWGIVQFVQDQQSPFAAMLTYLALVNAVLAVFNLVPGFPLDGGRVLRSILWGATGSLTKATNIAATVGRVFGWALIAFGLFQLFSGNFLGGIWLAFIGWFLSSAAEASRQEVTLRTQLNNVKVKHVMNTSTTTIEPETTVEDLVSNIFSKKYGRAVPVCHNGNIQGIVTVTDVKELPREKWSDTKVKQIMTKDPLYTASPEDDLNSVLQVITKKDINQLLVVQDGRCAGLLSRADILDHLQLSKELGLKRK